MCGRNSLQRVSSGSFLVRVDFSDAVAMDIKFQWINASITKPA